MYVHHFNRNRKLCILSLKAHIHGVNLNIKQIEYKQIYAYTQCTWSEEQQYSKRLTLWMVKLGKFLPIYLYRQVFNFRNKATINSWSNMNICLNYEARWKVPEEHKWLMNTQNVESHYCAQVSVEGFFHRIFSSVGCEVYDIMNSVLKTIFLSPKLKHCGAVVTSLHFTDKTQLVLI